MKKRIIAQEADRSKKLNELLRGLQDLYKDDVRNTVNLCYQLGATQEQVAQALGTSLSNVKMLYPKNGKEKK
jgi:DNA-directed RNA polymerase specialized sigma24 family protein